MQMNYVIQPAGAKQLAGKLGQPASASNYAFNIIYRSLHPSVRNGDVLTGARVAICFRLHCAFDKGTQGMFGLGNCEQT